jgi:hypothetical protein
LVNGCARGRRHRREQQERRQKQRHPSLPLWPLPVFCSRWDAFRRSSSFWGIPSPSDLMRSLVLSMDGLDGH